MDFDDITFPDDYDPFAPAPVTNNNNNTTTNQNTTDDNNKKEEAKAKKIQMVKLDENLLLSSKGLTRIKYESSFLKFKGRGHEAEDLAKLMRYYQIWAHNLYPRLRFQDFVSRVVKVTAKKRCRVTLSEWQKEYKDRRRQKELGKQEVEKEFSGMSLDDVDNAEKRIDELNAEIFSGGGGGEISSSNANAGSSTREGSVIEQEKNRQPRERTIIDDNDDDEMSEASSDDDQPLFITPKPRKIVREEEEDSFEIEERRKQKNSRADALAALLARRGKKL